MENEINGTAPTLQDPHDVEPMRNITDIRDELEWYLMGCIPWKDIPRIARVTDAIAGETPLNATIDSVQTMINGTDLESLPEGYGDILGRSLRLLLSLNRYDRWVRLYESNRPPSGDLLRITAYPMTESTTIVLSAKYLFGEYYPTVVYDVSTPHDVELECEQKAQGFARVEFRPDTDGNVSFSPRFGPTTDTGTHAAPYFDKDKTAFGETHGTVPEEDEMAEHNIPAAISEFSVTELPSAVDTVADYLKPRGIETDPPMMLRRIENSQAITEPIYAYAPGMYRVGYATTDDVHGSILSPGTGGGAGPGPGIGADAIGGPTSDTPALGPGADAPDDTTEYIVNIQPSAAANTGEEVPERGDDVDEDRFDHGDESAACLCDDFVYRGAPGNHDCKHILTVKRLINAGLLPPPTESPVDWLTTHLDACESIIAEYAREDRADQMRLDAEVILDLEDTDRGEPIAQRVRRVRQSLFAAVAQARQEPGATDFRMLVAEIARLVAPPVEAWSDTIIGKPPAR